MPSELPKMPTETYESLLRRNHSPGLSLQANEVAWFPTDRRQHRARNAFLLVAAATAFVVLMFLGQRAGTQ